MKRVLLMMVMALSLAACKKGQHVAPASSLLIGKWELRATLGGFKDSSYVAGNGTIYQFNSDNTYIHFTKGVQDDRGTYQYKKGGIVYSGIQFDALILNYTAGQPVTLNGDKLSIGTAVADGPQADFEKIPD